MTSQINGNVINMATLLVNSFSIVLVCWVIGEFHLIILSVLKKVQRSQSFVNQHVCPGALHKIYNILYTIYHRRKTEFNWGDGGFRKYYFITPNTTVNTFKKYVPNS